MRRRKQFASRDNSILKRTLFITLLFAVCAFAQDKAQQDKAQQDKVQQDDLPKEVKRLVDAYSIIESYAADPVDAEKIFNQGAIPGLLRRLDPHSVFFDPGQFEQVKQMQESTTKGFGTVVSILPGRVIVLQATPGTPSGRSGISPGDEILAVNNIRLDRLDMDQLAQLLGESRQRPARLDVRRPGNVRLMQFTLVPEEMQAPSVDRAFLVKPGYGYIRVTGFEEKTAAQIKEAIEKLGGQNLKGLVLDLRKNPGGMVTAALDTASMFLQPKQSILTIRGRKVKESVQSVPDDAHPYTFPLAVLLDEKSASASEIVAGALQDHDRAVIVGEPSFGKGLVQNLFPLKDGSGMALTTALYYTPSGRSIQKQFSDQRHLGDEDFALAATAAHPNQRTDFKSDKGRPLQGGGGIIPDVPVTPEAVSRLRAVLEQSASFTSFATEFLKTNRIGPEFEVTPQMLDQFKEYLYERQIQPGLQEWSRERTFIENRLKTEIFNQGLSVEKGDEVEAQRDAGIQKALSVLTGGA
jgi:carboxyl-terminal processing protease